MPVKRRSVLQTHKTIHSGVQSILGQIYRQHRQIMYESTLQKECVKVFGLKYPRLRDFLWHYPSGGYRTGREASKFKKMGVKAGVPDLMLMVPSNGYHGLFIELKVGTNDLTEDQELMLWGLKEKGYKVAVARTTSDFLDICGDYFK